MALCIVAGVAIGQFLPLALKALQRLMYSEARLLRPLSQPAEVSIPIAVLIWLIACASQGRSLARS